jgi:hypothetical protein
VTDRDIAPDNPIAMLKRAKYWQQFTAASQAAAERAAAAWWAEQTGFDKVCTWTLPADGSPRQWSVTIVYTPSEPRPASTTVH